MKNKIRWKTGSHWVTDALFCRMAFSWISCCLCFYSVLVIHTSLLVITVSGLILFNFHVVISYVFLCFWKYFVKKNIGAKLLFWQWRILPYEPDKEVTRQQRDAVQKEREQLNFLFQKETEVFPERKLGISERKKSVTWKSSLRRENTKWVEKFKPWRGSRVKVEKFHKAGLSRCMCT